MTHGGGLGWLGICRLGVIQASLGAIVVLTTSTLNRVMVVELALPALLPGALVAMHYAIQIMRPRFGHGSDCGGARTPWIIGGMLVLAFGGTLAAASTMVMAQSTTGGIALAIIAFLLVGAGVGASGTSLLVLLAATVSKARRAAAATITWVMMIAGFVVTTVVVGQLLDPFSFARLVWLTAAVGGLAVVFTALAVNGIEKSAATQTPDEIPRDTAQTPTQFTAALREVMSERLTRRFAVFVFISMLAYSAQDLLLEPFAGAVFYYTPGESTQLGGVQHGGVLLGMILVAVVGSVIARGRHDILRRCMIGGCMASALVLAALSLGAFEGGDWPLKQVVFALGLANGVFAVAAIGCMMSLVSSGHKKRDGVRMGVWGAAQAVAFGLGGLLGTGVIDVMRYLFDSTQLAYAVAFAIQAGFFLAASVLASTLSSKSARRAWSQTADDDGSRARISAT
jgi:BCD family chlorophyll transporter-like MFS transporter